MINEQIKDYALLMLGAPVVEIELDQQQLDFCLLQAEALIKAYEAEPKKQAELTEAMRIQFLKDGTLYYAEAMIGRIRRDDVLINRGMQSLEALKVDLTWALDYPDN